jgi:replicative DNA helicase
MDRLQATTLKAMLHKRWWHEFEEVLRPDVLTNALVREVHDVLQRLHAMTEGDLTLQDVQVNIHASYEGDRREELLAVVGELATTPEVNDHVLRDSVRNYVATELRRQATIYMATRLGTDQLDSNIPQDLMARAADISEGVHTQVTKLDDIGLPGEADVRTNVCPLGLSPDLDSVLDGGAGGGELVILLAPPGRGKTSYLCSIGGRAATAGKRVLHVTLEISLRRVGRRYDQVYTGLTREEMIAAPTAVAAARKQVKGEVYCKDWSYASVTPADIKALVKAMRSDDKPIDLVIVDYLELLEPNRRLGRFEQRHAYGQLGKDMRAVAVALDVPIITAWQVNREGSGNDFVGLHHVSESWEVIKHADTILGMNQSRGELDAKTLRLSVLKMREGTARPEFQLYSNLDTCQIRKAGTYEDVQHDPVRLGYSNGVGDTGNADPDGGVPPASPDIGSGGGT